MSPTDKHTRSLLGRIAAAAASHRRAVLAVWIVAVAATVIAGRAAGGSFSNDLSVPGTDSQAAFDALRARFPERAGDSMQIVLRAPTGVADPRVRPAVEGALARIRRIPGVSAVQSPYGKTVRAISRDGHIGFATVQFAQRAKDIPPETIDAVKTAADSIRATGTQVEFGGAPVETETGPSGSEVIGLLAALLVLMLAFGSVIAAALPLATAVFALAFGVSLIRLLAGLTSIGRAGPVVAAMIGLGVGIDYALLIVTRHRENLARGLDPERSIVVAMATAGRSVLVAGTTVIVAILGLYLIGINFVAAIGLASAITVATTLLASITLLPALLAFAGRGIDRWRINLFHHDGRADHTSGWQRFARGSQRHPWVAMLASLVVLLTLAIPLASMRLGTGDAGANRPSTTTRRAYDLMVEGFGPGFTGPLLVTISAPPGRSAAPAAMALAAAMRTTPGVAAVTPPAPNRSADTFVTAVVPRTSPQDSATEALVHRLRNRVIPSAVSGVDVHVGGPTAMGIDIADRLADRLPIFMIGVIMLSFLLLMVEFRSLFVPLKAALMNLLSIGAAYGAVVAVFQWGWLGGVLGQRSGPIESFAPMMLFAVLFGLSMDYEVFLLSRVREEYERTGDNARAVADGLASTARIITAAASVMVIVFASFLLNEQRVVNMFGFGLAAAILVDATIVRMILVPATMTLAGRANWWMPRWLDRVLPRLEIEARGDDVLA